MLSVRRTLFATAGLATAGLLAMGTSAASASTHPHHAQRPNTIGCAVNINCFDIYNAQAGPNFVLSSANSLVGTQVKLASRNPQSSHQDFTYVLEGLVQSTIGGDSSNFPFADPNVDFQYQGQQVFLVQHTPNGNTGKQVYAGAPGPGNKIALAKKGVFGSQAFQNNLWVASDLPQFNGTVPVINVGWTNTKGDTQVLTIKQGATNGAVPFVSALRTDALGQVPPVQQWQGEPNYP